ncbi:MAG: glycosyltransferase family 2 protein [Verrucomicrobiota bacterium]|nr:glycosyltransferase family 2 protein [Verrucomicrobiota bacterium]
MQKIAVIIPAYNEESSIALVVNEVNEFAKNKEFKIIAVVVNDWSRDSTSQIIAKLNCVSLNLPINLGIGGAVQTGFKYALENNFNIAIQLDGDGQHPPAEIEKLLKEMKSTGVDVVIGSRFISNDGFQSSMIRRMGINYFKWLNHLLVGIKISDSTSGFRMINKKALELVCEYYPDEYPEPEAIILFAKRNLKISEAQVLMRERQGGKSSINSFSAVYYMFKVTLAILFTFVRLKVNKL